MSISIVNKPLVLAEPVGVAVTKDSLSVDLSDGRTITVPLQWFPRLFHGTPAEWANYELSYEGVHWPDLNEDICVDGLLRGEKSGESAKSIKRFLAYRAKGEKEPIPELPLPPAMEKELRKIWDPEAKKESKKAKPRRKRVG